MEVDGGMVLVPTAYEPDHTLTYIMMICGLTLLLVYIEIKVHLKQYAT